MIRFRTRLLTAAALAVTGIAAIGAALHAQPPLLVRGPYLQTGTPTSLVVRWRTATPSDSVVRFGTAPGQLDSMVSSALATTEHVVRLDGLTPHTRYFYAIGSAAATLAGNDLGHSFVTAPPAGARVPTRIWVLGDSGTADANARQVRDRSRQAMWWREPDLWLMLGDNAYYTGTDAEHQAAIFDVYGETLRRTVLWPTFGNHDAVSADAATQTGPYFDIFTLPTAGEAGGVGSSTEAYYSFDYANVHFICLDSTESDRSPTGPMVTWLRRDLAARRAEWTIAFFHHPPYSKGSHDSDVERELVEMRENVAPVLEADGVDLVLSGHSHAYERTMWLNGHYGPSSTLGPQHLVDAGNGYEGGDGAYRKLDTPGARGTLYFVAGNGGQASSVGLHPAMANHAQTLGSLAIDVDGPRLQVRLLATAEASPGVDVVTLVKHAPGRAPDPPAAPSATATAGTLDLTWEDGGGGWPDDYVIEAGSAPGRADVGRLATGSRVAHLTTRVGPGRVALRTRARNALGESAPSIDTVLDVDANGNTPPPAPVVMTSQVAADRVAVTLAAASGPPPGTTQLFEVGSAPGRTDLAVLPVIAGGLFASGVPAGAYYARARAATAAGLGPASREVQLVVGGVPAIPGVPGVPRAMLQGRDVTLVWAPPATGSPATRYVIDAGLRPGELAVRVPTADSTPRVVFRNVPPGAYYLRVRGQNPLGLGLASDDVLVRVP